MTSGSDLEPFFQGRRYLVAYCPFHEDRGRPNFVLYPQKGICFRCGAEVGPEEVRSLLLSGSLELAGGGGKGNGKREEAKALEALFREAYDNLWQGALRPRQAYLRERGIGTGFAQSRGIGHTGSAFLIPFRDREGRLVGAKLRADPAFDLSWRYKNWPGTPSLLYRPFPEGSPTVLVEGELDTLLLAQWGIDALAPSTGVWSLLSLPLPKKRPLLLLLDWDEAGQEVGRRLEREGKGVLVERPEWGEGAKDIGEALLRLPEERRYDELLALLHRAALAGLGARKP